MDGVIEAPARLGFTEYRDAQDDDDLLVWGQGRFGESLLQHRLIDTLDLSIHPLVIGRGKQFFREDARVSIAIGSDVADPRNIKGLSLAARRAW